MTIVTLDEVAEEFAESVAYYEEKEPGLGMRFRQEVAATVEWISKHAEIPRVRGRGYRRVNLRTFPHYIAYVIREEAVWILAVAHGHRRPEFWVHRRRRV